MLKRTLTSIIIVLLAIKGYSQGHLKKHVIVFFDNQLFVSMNNTSIVVNDINKLLVSRFNSSAFYFTFCTFNAEAQSLQTGDVVEARWDASLSNKFIPSLISLANSKKTYFGSTVNALESLENRYAQPPNALFFDSCFVLTISKTDFPFYENTLSSCNVELSISDDLTYTMTDDDGYEYDSSINYTFRLINATPSCKLFKKSVVSYNTDRRTTSNGNVELFLTPDKNTDSLIEISAEGSPGNGGHSVQILSIKSYGFGNGSNTTIFNGGWPISEDLNDATNEQIRSILLPRYTNGNSFPLFSLFDSRLALAGDNSPTDIQGSLVFSYICNNGIYNHILYHDTETVSIKVEAMKKLPLSEKFIDNAEMMKRAKNRIVTQDQLLWEAYSSNKWILSALIAAVVLLAAGLVWWIYVGRHK